MNRWRARLAKLQSEVSAQPAHVQNVQIVQKSPSPHTSEHFEQIEQRPERVTAAHDDTWTGAEEERAAVIEYDGGGRRPWAEALARLDPAKPLSDVPLDRWQQFIDDCGRFLDQGWANRAEALGWGPLDLFGCDRARPLSRYDGMGLLWIIQGRRLVALTAETATIDTLTGSLQTYRRRPVEVGRIVLPWVPATRSYGV
jgi:hypothetical protein